MTATEDALIFLVLFVAPISSIAIVNNMTTVEDPASSLSTEDPCPERARSAEELEALHKAELEDELARLKRLGIFATFVSAVMLSFMFLPLVIPILLLVAGLVYLCSPCLTLGLQLALSPPSSSSKVDHHDDPKPTDERGSILDQATDIHHDRQVQFGFDQARSEIRDCPLPRPAKSPPEGVYQIVYAAEYFGRVLRTEGELWLQWRPVSNGWEIRGQSRSSAGSAEKMASTLHDGFLNSEGEIYWLSDGKASGKHILFRGTLDLETWEMFDGEFLSKDDALQGRIVRMSLSKEMSVPPLDDTTRQPFDVPERDWGSLDIEMVAQEPEELPEFD